VIPLAAAQPLDVDTPLGDVVHGPAAGFCTGCPERPIFSAMKLVERELGAHHVSADIGCHLFSILPPFTSATRRWATGSARRARRRSRPKGAARSARSR
jgi:TPP-dependent indolepyruvate ferredoxin oxidoreductase alpha subunit